ncbi:hypothetical protein LOH54_04460 [Sulfurimonas sp. HSL-3221]|uniref:hypothetical protein n=1 Tax=Sulfurimonadaceae TaxID=2771471 RepID=UPI001E4E4263|nr:hypothetical protein [Sulfurimonas sp. HSL-3221]UFS63386.1 hypothetical protein LOH54_04460 [Sulfurimonas sp. HSL-3221]
MREKWMILMLLTGTAVAFGAVIATPPIQMTGKVQAVPEYVEVDRTGYMAPVITTPAVEMHGRTQ